MLATFFTYLLFSNRLSCSQGHNDPCDAFKFRLYPAVMSLSCICLALTIAVYSALPELRNLPGKNVVCLSASLLLAFACLSGK